MSPTQFFSSLFLLLLSLSFATPNPLLAPPSTTIPAFPEQSNVAGCQLDLPDDDSSFHRVKTVCGTPPPHTGQHLHRSRCCPVLAAWLYAAYSATALSQQSGGRVSTAAVAGRTDTQQQYDLPLLPDDSETCADNLGKALEGRGMELAGPNKSCDLVFCYCGIRLHPLTCPEAFGAGPRGELVGDGSVERLEKACLSSSNGGRFSGLGGCNNCLNKLYMIGKNSSKISKSEDKKRTTKMHDKDCELMAITWLLAKNRTAYIRSVSLVLRALIMSTDGSDPLSCTLNSDGMPLAVDSAEFFDQSRGRALDCHRPSICLLIVSVVSVLSVMVFT